MVLISPTAKPQPVQPPAATTPTPPTAAKPKDRGKGKFFPILFVLIVAAVLVGGGYWFFRVRPGRIVSGTYQAVFLSNGQVYFGKVAKTSSNEVLLKDIYYLIIRRPLQQQTPEATPTAEQQKPEYTLIKLGRELHGPMDEMRINRRHVLFIENLKEDGKVVQAIKQSKAQPQE